MIGTCETIGYTNSERGMHMAVLTFGMGRLAIRIISVARVPGTAVWLIGAFPLCVIDLLDDWPEVVQ